MRLKGFSLGLLLLAGSAHAQELDLDQSFNTILAELNNRIYVISETHGSTEAYEEAMQQAAQDLKSLLKNPALKESMVKNFQEHDPLHNGMLHDAAFYGYYPLVEVLLKDERVKSEINLPNKLDLKPLDLSRGALKSHFVFTYPERLCSPFGLVPLIVVDLGFYKSELSPYTKASALLKQAGAKNENSIQDIYKKFIEYRMKKLKEPQIPAPIQLALTIQMEASIKQIDTLAVQSDEEIMTELSRIQMSVVNQQDHDKSYNFVNTDAFDHLCNALN